MTKKKIMSGMKETSKYISLILRHKPEAIGISLDEHGWANVDELISGVAKTHELDMYNAGYKFFLSKNGVWLTKKVPVEYLEKHE